MLPLKLSKLLDIIPRRLWQKTDQVNHESGDQNSVNQNDTSTNQPRSNRLKVTVSKIGKVFYKNHFGFLVLFSVGAHAAFWLLLPNPFKQTKQPEQIQVSSIIPVVSLPSAKARALSKLNLQDQAKRNLLEQISRPPASEPLTVTPLDIPQNLEPTYIAENSLPDIGMKPEKLVLDQKPDPTVTEKKITQQDLENDIAANSENGDRPKLENQPAQTSEQQPNPVQNSPTTTSSDISPDSPNSKSPESLQPEKTTASPNNQSQKLASDSDGVWSEEAVRSIFTNYADRIETRIIAPESAVVDFNRREPDVEWIAPEPQQIAIARGQEGVVEIGLLVNPEGIVEKQLIKSSGVNELDEIVNQTVKGYYNKFRPMEEEFSKGKYRYITIKYEFPISSTQ